jgi:hypothetical protein
LFYADFKDMIAARGVHDRFAQVHEIQIDYKSPNAGGPPTMRTMYDIVADAFLAKGGTPAARKRMPDPYGDGARYGAMSGWRKEEMASYTCCVRPMAGSASSSQ